MNAQIQRGEPLIIESTAMAQPAGQEGGRVSATSRIDRTPAPEGPESVPEEQRDWIPRAIEDLGSSPADVRTKTILQWYQNGRLTNDTDGFIARHNADPRNPGSLFFLRGGPIPPGHISHYTRLIRTALSQQHSYEAFLALLRDAGRGPDHDVWAGLNMVERTCSQDPEVYGSRMMGQWVGERQEMENHILSLYPRIALSWSQGQLSL